jgi:hypothetical protein
MSSVLVPLGARAQQRTFAGVTRVALDRRRGLQLTLATMWLLDGVLQLQGGFFASQFGRSMLKPLADANPAIVAKPINWVATVIQHNPQWTNASFAAIQIMLGLAIAYRLTLKAGLAASVVWALAVWWFGEGLGGVLNGTASTFTGAPGAVILYALLAVLLWPTARPALDGFEAARLVGRRVANLLWAVLWVSLAWFAIAGSNRSSLSFSQAISGEASGEPGWLAAMDTHLASWMGHDGLSYALLLGALCLLIAGAVFLPRTVCNVVLVLAVLVALVIWVVGQNLGGLFNPPATDVNSGPLLALLAVAYWKAQTPIKRAGAAVSQSHGVSS